MFCLSDRLKHGGICSITIHQRLDSISGQQGPFNHPAHYPGQHMEVARVPGQMLP